MQEYLKRLGLPPTVLLELDNIPSHSLESELYNRDGPIYVLYLPPTNASLLQTMNQDIIEPYMRRYIYIRVLDFMVTLSTILNMKY